MKKDIKRIDIEYVKRYQRDQKDLEAFNAIYNFYKDYLLYFAFTYTKDMNDAEEVVQETFVKMIHKIHTLEKVESFHAWLYKICYTNVMLHYRTKNRYNQFDDENGSEEIEDIHKTDQENIKRQLYEEIYTVISGLEVRFQPVAQLYYFDELKIKEIAGILEVPEGTIKSRLNKIRSDLKTRLERSGISPRSFLSIGFTPFMYGYFQEIMQTVQMDPNQARQMLGVLHKTTTVITTTTLGKTVTHTITKQKVGASLGIALAGTFMVSYFLPKEPVAIEQVNYHQELTNKTVEVDVLLSTEVNKEDIDILYKEEEISFIQKDNTVSFEAKTNGVYTIQVVDQTKEIDITTIDKQAPIMDNVHYIDNGIQLEMHDNHAIDYEKSYAVYQDIQYKITNTNSIVGDFKEPIIKVVLYDTTGNSSVYELTSEVMKQ